MDRPTLILIHGMGDHTPESFKEDFLKGMSAAFELYPSQTTKQFTDYVDLVALGYNDFFEEYRTGDSDREKFDEILQGLPTSSLKKLFERILKLQESLDDDDFFFSHWLDVLIYRFTSIGTNIQIRIADAVADAIMDEGGNSRHVHILGHSLGTAVMHDSLAKAYTPGSPDIRNPLDVTSNKLGSLHFVANTSRLLESFVKVDKSPVKPGPWGCTRLYREYRHTLDPISRIRPFNPTGNGGWIGDYPWSRKHYQLELLTSVTNEHGNTHRIEHYLFNPASHLHLLKEVAGIELDRSEVEQGSMDYLSQTLGDVALKAESAFKDIEISDKATVLNFVEAVEALKKFVKKLGGQI